jgi:uncharacterized membrane protein
MMAPLIVLVGGFAVLRVLGLQIGALDGWPPALRGALAAMFLFTGLAHFIGKRRDGLVAMVPPRLTRPDLLVTITGGLELAGAGGLILAPTYRLAAACLAALLVVMFPANVHAARHDVALGGRPATPLPTRTAMRLFYLGCCTAAALT